MNQITKKVEGLRRTILTLEWDIPNIKNGDLKAHRESVLKKYKEELESLLKNKGQAS